MIGPFARLFRKGRVRNLNPEGWAETLDRESALRGPSEKLFMRACRAMGWEYRFRYWPGPYSRSRKGPPQVPYGHWTIEATAAVRPGRPEYGRGVVEFPVPGSPSVVSAYEFGSFPGDDLGPADLSSEAERTCGRWLAAAYAAGRWLSSNRIEGSPGGGLFPASSGQELALRLEAAGL